MKEEILLRQILGDNGFKTTRPRLVVFQLLRHHGMQSLAELNNRTEGKADRVSVYRVIDLFEKLGIARRVTIGWKYKVELSDIFLNHHHHITCLECGRVQAIRASKDIENTIHTLTSEPGFIITSHQLELQGYCKKCHPL